MKYSLSHCYTDKNKGDAAIIIATVQLIRSLDENASVQIFSTYGDKDNRFNEDHEDIKKYADVLYPGLFYDPQPLFGSKNDKSRIFSFIIIFIKYLLVLVSSNKFFLKLILSENERLSVNALLSSDIIISKGGSYLTTQNKSLRQTFSLIRMLYPFIFAKRYNKKMYIFSQSLGPIFGNFNLILFQKSLNKVRCIYLRERLCLENYNSVSSLCSKVPCKIIPDTAFFLESDDPSENQEIIDSKEFNVGYTLVDHAFKYLNSESERVVRIENYKLSIIESIKYVIDSKNAIVHIFPQVLANNSFAGHNDIKISQEIIDYFNDTVYEGKIHFYNVNWTPTQLRHLYSKMEIFIGTRLHSVIFALSVGTPSINISYHGTKSQGILNDIPGFEHFIIDIDHINPQSFMKLVCNLISNRYVLSQSLISSISDIKIQLTTAMSEIVSEKIK
jgi:polysaccharide pyruvyl transferase WcaK-like protein